MSPHSTPRPVRSNLVWIVGITAGLLVGGIVAYGLTSVGTATATAGPSRR